ncbi:MAG: polysaccharide biosynthesis protein [Eubacteriales bacterium]
MSRKRTFIKGAFILTATGIISRCIGFLSRIFLSQIFGAEGLGLYQLIFPIFALCFALSTAGIETSISRIVSAKISLGRVNEAKRFALSSMFFSISLSIICTILLQRYALPISTYFLKDERTYPLLIILSYSFPFASIHSCIVGYYLGLKQTLIPSISQLIEQACRVLSIYLLYHLCLSQNITCDISLAVIGLVIGEFISTIFTICCVAGQKHQLFQTDLSFDIIKLNLLELLPNSAPLTANRVTLNLLQSIEAISIPVQLQVFGYSSSEALSTYGVLIGMALPCLLFPTALTSSVSAMLLPTIAESQAQNNKKEIQQVVLRTMQYGITLGVICLISFFLLSDLIGIILFNNSEVSSYLKVLAWLCPFLYLNTNLLTIITALGKPHFTFSLNAIGLAIRIGCIYSLIPIVGISGYLWALLGSQIFITSGCLFIYKKLCII